MEKSISERTEPVDFVDHDDIDQSILDVGQQAFQAGAFQRAAGNAAVVILVANQHPAFRPLAGDVGLAGLALGVQAVEFLFKTLLGRLPRIDRTAQLTDELVAFDGRVHAAPRWFFSPKKTQPFQRVPVMARAMAERDLKGCPCHSKPSVDDRHDMLDALVFPDQPRADDRHQVGADRGFSCGRRRPTVRPAPPVGGPFRA